MGYYKTFLTYLAFVIIVFTLLLLPMFFEEEEASSNTLNILTYSSFIKPWGPGPWVAKAFKDKYGIDVRWIDAGNAGLILERLRFKSGYDQPDVVLGFDQFSVSEARKIVDWKDVQSIYKDVPHKALPKGSQFNDFLAFDWGALTFVYRGEEVSPPQSIEDLLKTDFSKKLILQDPRMSSPGLQFLFWILTIKGVDEGFEYLSQLRNSIKILAPSWSSAYSLFQVEKETMVFSYFTSPLYHKIEEENDDYRSVVFSHPHPVQVEYAGIPDVCRRCEDGFRFLQFLASKEAQKVIMEKNYMMPMNAEAMEGSDFKIPEGTRFLSPIESWKMIRDKKTIVERWKKVFY